MKPPLPDVPAPEGPTCAICGQPLPTGEEMFIYHGFSGPCPTTPVEEEDAPVGQWMLVVVLVFITGVSFVLALWEAFK